MYRTLRPGNAGVIEQDIYATEFLYRLIDHSLDIFFLSHVGGYSQSLNFILGQYTQRFIDLPLVAGSDGNIGPECRHSFGVRPADTAAAACNQSNPSGKIENPSISHLILLFLLIYIHFSENTQRLVFWTENRPRLKSGGDGGGRSLPETRHFAFASIQLAALAPVLTSSLLEQMVYRPTNLTTSKLHQWLADEKAIIFVFMLTTAVLRSSFSYPSKNESKNCPTSSYY